MKLPSVDHDRRRRILLGVARNPAAPLPVLRRLARQPWAAPVVAGREDIADGVAELLLDVAESEVAVVLGENDHLSASVRGRLALHADPLVRRTVPRPPPATGPRPGCEVPESLLRLLAADPDPGVRAAVPAHPRISEEVLAQLAEDPEGPVRAAVARRWTEPPEPVLRAFLTDPEPEVRAACCTHDHPAPPEDLLGALLGDPATRALVVPRAELDEGRARDLAGDPDPAVRAAVARNPGLPSSVREQLAADGSAEVRCALLLAPATPDAMRADLHEEVVKGAAAGDGEWPDAEQFVQTAWRDSAELAWLRKQSPNRRVAHLDSPFTFFRRAVAATAGDLPGEAVLRLLRDQDAEVRLIAARYAAQAPPAELERIVREHGDLVEEGGGITGRPDFPRKALALFAVDDRPELRRLAAAAEGLSPELLAALATDQDWRVRREAAARSGLPQPCLPELLADERAEVAEAAGSSPELPVAWMKDLLTADDLFRRRLGGREQS